MLEGEAAVAAVASAEEPELEEPEEEEEEAADTSDEEKLMRLRTRRSGPEPFFPNDLESQRKRALAAINASLENPLGDDPGVAETTEDRRKYHMQAWRR
jgi:hypothetical protein